jgi:hypothetical protein
MGGLRCVCASGREAKRPARCCAEAGGGAPMRARACAFPPQTARRTTSGLGRHLGRAPAPRRPPRPPRCVVPHVCVCALALSRGSKALANATELRGRRQGERPHLAASIILAAPLSSASGSPPRPLSVTPAGVVASHALAMARRLEAKSASRSSWALTPLEWGEGRKRCGVVFTELPRSPGCHPQVAYDVSGPPSEFGGCTGMHVGGLWLTTPSTAGGERRRARRRVRQRSARRTIAGRC